MATFQSPDGDSSLPDRVVAGSAADHCDGFSPLTGILYVRTTGVVMVGTSGRSSFSPLTGILYVRTLCLGLLGVCRLKVSVP